MDNKVYVVLVCGKLKTGQLEKFKELFKPLADHVMANESGAISYQLAVSEEEPDKFIIYERYISKDYLSEVHWESSAFKEFRARTAEAGIEWEFKDVHKYWEELPGAYGYMTK